MTRFAHWAPLCTRAWRSFRPHQRARQSQRRREGRNAPQFHNGCDETKRHPDRGHHPEKHDSGEGGDQRNEVAGARDRIRRVLHHPTCVSQAASRGAEVRPRIRYPMHGFSASVAIAIATCSSSCFASLSPRRTRARMPCCCVLNVAVLRGLSGCAGSLPVPPPCGSLTGQGATLLEEFAPSCEFLVTHCRRVPAISFAERALKGF